LIDNFWRRKNHQEQRGQATRTAIPKSDSEKNGVISTDRKSLSKLTSSRANHWRGIMIKNGLYKISTEFLDGAGISNVHVIILHDGKLLGGGLNRPGFAGGSNS
jgi:hypothetical protein